MRTGIVVSFSPADHARLAKIAADRNSPQQHVWQTQIVLFLAQDIGTHEIMRVTGKAKTCVWRWQERSPDVGRAAGRDHPLGRSRHGQSLRGQSLRGQRQFGASHLAQPRAEAAPGAPVQAVQRSAFRASGSGRGCSLDNGGRCTPR